MSLFRHRSGQFGTVMVRGSLQQVNAVTDALRVANGGKSREIIDRLLTEPEQRFFQDKIEDYEKLLTRLFELMEPVLGPEQFHRGMVIEEWVEALVKKCQDLTRDAKRSPLMVGEGSFAWAVQAFAQGFVVGPKGPSDIRLNPQAPQLYVHEVWLRNAITMEWEIKGLIPTQRGKLDV